MDLDEDVISANEAFYDAFCAADMSAMRALWAHDASVSCLHPGWNPIYGRDSVLASWDRILSSPDRPNVQCLNATARVNGESAIVTCHEKLGGGYLIATNLFVLEEGAWRMVHHHASGAPSPDQLA